nr:MAG TPA: hypothetical protein [Caudoviricetes sp.]
MSILPRAAGRHARDTNARPAEGDDAPAPPKERPPVVAVRGSATADESYGSLVTGCHPRPKRKRGQDRATYAALW